MPQLMESFTHRKIYDLACGAKRPVLIADKGIDGDALGSSLAMADFFRRRGVDAPVYVVADVPEKYQNLPHLDLCTSDASIFENEAIDLVISFDCSNEEYVKELTARIPGEFILVNIDHHHTNSHYGDVNQVLVDSPATAEVMYRFFRVNGEHISREAATALLSGICFDTTALSNNATNEDAFAAASDLVMCGGDAKGVIRAILLNRSVPSLRVWGAALSRVVEHDCGFVSTYLTRKDIDEAGVVDDDVDGLSNFLNLVLTSDNIVVLRETIDGGVKASMRSRVKDVGEIAKTWGGGGHKAAAGFVMPGTCLKEKKEGWEVCNEKGDVILHPNHECFQ